MPTCLRTESRKKEEKTCVMQHQLRSCSKDQVVRPASSDEKMSSSKIEQIVAPRRKEDYVQAIACRCNVSVEDLRTHTVDQLKELYAVVKPKKKSEVLPVGWKKFDLEGLRNLYVERVVEDLRRDPDGHWARWKRPQFVLELEMWEAEIKEATRHDPFCSACMIPMMIRTNRLDGTDFYGCRRFPSCRQTLPLTHGGRPTAVVQKELEIKKEGDKKTDEKKNPLGYPAKQVIEDVMSKTAAKKETERKRAAAKQAATSGASSDGSWVAAGAQPIPDTSDEDSPEKEHRIFNANLTPEEMAAIQLMREGQNMTKGVNK
eukprot:s656_g3.t1